MLSRLSSSDGKSSSVRKRRDWSAKRSNSGKQSSSDWRGNKRLCASVEELERLRERAEREEQERLEAESQRRRQQEIAAEQERSRQQEAQRRRQQELAEASAAEAARTEFELVQSATALIQQAVQETWSRPPSARNGMRAVLQIRMLPTGEVLDAVITQSSGDPAFDRSAENALYRAAPFRELQSLPINVFNANFRSLSLIFEPEDLLN